MLHPKVGVWPESLAVALFDEADILSDEMAFRRVDFARKRYVEDRRAGHESLHFYDIDLHTQVPVN